MLKVDYSKLITQTIIVILLLFRGAGLLRGVAESNPGIWRAGCSCAYQMHVDLGLGLTMGINY